MDLERTKYIRELRRYIIAHFDIDELQTLTFDLAVDWDELKGETKSTKTQAMLNHLAQRGRLEDLLILLREERSNVTWPDIPPAEQQFEDQQSLNPNLTNLDRELFLKIREILPSGGSIQFVRVHDYGGSFPRDRHNDLLEFSQHIEKPEFEFFDLEMEDLRRKLANNIQEFLRIIGQETFPVRTGDRNRIPRIEELETLQALRHRARDQAHFEQIYEEYKVHLNNVHQALNEFANQIVKTYDEFIRVGRRKLAV